jgi:hypothetical protein
MALMLRMVGIPSRVVAGFAPGAFDKDRDIYTVHDTDAHSWVEVYFRGIGWATFDPTPSAAPAAAQKLELGGPVAIRRDGSSQVQGAGRREDIEAAADGGVLVDGPRGEATPLLPIAAGLLAAFALGAGFVTIARRRRLRSPRSPALQARELRDAIAALGWEAGPRTTLRGIETRFERVGRHAVSAYARGLREYRFSPRAGPPPGGRERRLMRRALARDGGLRARLRALRAVPPGGPAG